MREAVLGLLEAGYLTRRHGSGTYVTKAPRSRHALDTTVSYTAMIREAGHEPGETVISKAVRAPTEHECELLDARRRRPVHEVERVRLADDRPVIYSRDRIPAALLSGIAAGGARQLAVRDPRDGRPRGRAAPAPSCSRRSPTTKLARAAGGQARHAAAAHRPGRLRRARAAR